MPAYVEHAVVLFLGAMLAVAFWRASRPRLAFVVRIIDGQPAAMEGVVTPAFLLRLRDMAAKHGVDAAKVVGYEHEGAIRLRFSRQVPEPGRQQMRNWWAMYGWNAPRSCPTNRCG